MNHPQQLKIALFGAGRMAQIHAQNIADNPDLLLTHVCSRSMDSARRLALPFGAEPTIDPDAIMDPAARIDAVLIASPNNTHHDLLVAAAVHGIAALCEKPIDSDIERVRSSLPHMNQSTAPVMIAFNRRYDPHFASAQQRTARGEIGRLEQLTIISRDPAPSPKEYVATSGASSGT